MYDLWRSCMDRPLVKTYTHYDISFHKFIAANCGNNALGLMLESFWLIIERVTSDWLSRLAKYVGDEREAIIAKQDHLNYVSLS